MSASSSVFPIIILPYAQKSEASKPIVANNGTRINLLGLDSEELSQFFVSLGERSFRGKQVLKWIHRLGIEDFGQMTDLSKSLREQLAKLCEIRAPEIVREQCSIDGTRKWLIRLEDGNHIETVFIPEKDRGTLCVSSQVGCALNCSFCSTATQGFNRNLSAAEIIGQVWLASQQLKFVESHDREKVAITNVVMMGMGEPLLNVEAVLKAMSIMRDDLAYALPRRRVTLSTSGYVPNIDRVSQEADVSLAVSLHAPNDELRTQLVPLNKKYPIAVLMDACHRFVSDKQGRHVTMEYVMLKEVNDKKEHARQLVKILQGLPCKVNLIPFNPFPGAQYQQSTYDTIEAFKAILIKAGFVTTVRKTRGDDIDAACGQLVGRITDRTRRHIRFLAKTGGQNRVEASELDRRNSDE